MHDLLQHLGHRGLHHGPVGLKIAAHHAQKSGKENGGREHPQHHRRFLGEQQARPEKREQARRAAHDDHIEDRDAENALRVLVLAHRQPLGYHLGDRRRDAVGGDQQDHLIITVCGCIITVAGFPDDVGQRTSVQKPDDPAHDARHRQDPSLFYKGFTPVFLSRHKNPLNL